MKILTPLDTLSFNLSENVLGIFLDSETNGLNFHKHKLVELAFKILDVETGELKGSFHAMIAMSKEEWHLSDPESLKVNGFTWEEVSQGERKEVAAAQVKALFTSLNIKRGSAVFICQNPSFDRAFFSQLIDGDEQEHLRWPYHWLDLASMYWAEAIRGGRESRCNFPWETGYSKDKIAVTYQLEREKQPHRAMNGVDHLILCYKSVVGFAKRVL